MSRIKAVGVVLVICLVAAMSIHAADKKAMAGGKALLIEPPQPITDADRALTEVPYAKGSPAVVLLEAFQKRWERLEFTRNIYLRRTKILDQDGVTSHGDFVFYLPSTARVQTVQARTLLPDGTEIDAAESTNQERTTFGFNTVKVAFPRVEVGAILELEIQYNSDSFMIAPWVIQRSIPVQESRFIMIPPEGLHYSTVLAGLPQDLNKAESVPGPRGTAYVWRFHDITPLSQEPNLPPEDDIAQQLFVIFNSYKTSSVYFPIAADWKSWNKRRSEHWEEWLEGKSSSAKSLAKSVVSTEMTAPAKAEAIRLALKDRVQVDWRGTWPLHDTPDELLSKGSGNSADLAGTVVSMLRKVGVKADPASVRRRSDGSIPFDFPVPARFNDTVVRFEHEGRMVFFSPVIDAPVGSRHYDFSGILAFPYDKTTTEPTILPDFSADQNQYVRTVQVELDASGDLRARSKHDYRGVAASSWRNKLRDLSEEEIKAEVQDRLRRWVGGAVVTSVEIESPDEDWGRLTVGCTWEATGYATPAGKRLIFNPHLISRVSVDDWAMDVRSNAIHLGNSYETVDTVSLTLPEGAAEVTLPEELKFEVKNVGLYEMRYRREEGRIVAERRMRLDRYSFPPSAFSVLKQWMSKVAESDDSPIVVTLQ